MAFKSPVIIIGAGFVGLSLANGLKQVTVRGDSYHEALCLLLSQAGIPFEVYERDAAMDSRGHEWAITIHWAFSQFEKFLPSDVLLAVLATEVDPGVGRNDTGTFLVLNSALLDPEFKIPPASRRRFNLEKMRLAF